MLAVVGVVVFRLVVLRGLTRVTTEGAAADTRFELSDAARRLGLSALLLLSIAMLSRLYGEANAVLGPGRAFDRAALATMLFGTSWGAGWLVGLAGVVLAALGFVVAKRSRSNAGWAVVALGAVGIVLAPSLTGHAMSTPPVAVSVAIDVLHVTAVCAWLGGLLALLFTAIPFVRGSRVMSALGTGPLVAALVRAFHPVALTCAGIVVATGLVAAWLRLPTLASLWESTYGRVLLVKLCFVALVVVLGGLNWRRMLPRLGDEAAARRITRTASVELAIAAVVLAVTAVLVSTSPPQ
jgi:copper transport protein